MLVRNIEAIGNIYLIFLGQVNLMSRRHIWLTTEWYFKFFETVMIFLKSHHDMIYKKLNCIKIVKLFGG